MCRLGTVGWATADTLIEAATVTCTTHTTMDATTVAGTPWTKGTTGDGEARSHDHTAHTHTHITNVSTQHNHVATMYLKRKMTATR